MDKGKLEELIEFAAKGNSYSEKITLIGATKYQSVETINSAIELGLTDIGENKADEFREKFAYYADSKKHFIGHLQTNKIKYLIGKVDLYHSIDSLHLAEKLNEASQRLNIVSNILIQVNIGCEESKSGFNYEDVEFVYSQMKKFSNLKIEGLMAMLPKSEDENYLRTLAKKMRVCFDELKAIDNDIKYLSMGMSHDYKLCVEEGSNMIRIGSSIFGPRPLNFKVSN